jgi:hypothetical protein
MPAERFASAAAFAQALEGSATVPLASILGTPGPAAARRSPGRAFAGATAVGLLMIGLGLVPVVNSSMRAPPETDAATVPRAVTQPDRLLTFIEPTAQPTPEPTAVPAEPTPAVVEPTPAPQTPRINIIVGRREDARDSNDDDDDEEDERPGGGPKNDKREKKDDE